MTLPPETQCNPGPPDDRWPVHKVSRQAAALIALAKDWKREDQDTLLAKHTPQGQELSRRRAPVRTEFFGLEPPCSECEEDELEPPEPE